MANAANAQCNSRQARANILLYVRERTECVACEAESAGYGKWRRGRPDPCIDIIGAHRSVRSAKAG